jgi:uncharacterized protein YkwD
VVLCACEARTPGDSITVQRAGGPNPAPSQPQVAPSYPPTTTAAGDAFEGLARLNAYRTAASLDGVALGAESSNGCEKHLAYLAWESASQHVACILSHDEPDKANPYRTALGESAGRGALLACAPEGTELGVVQAVDRWIGSLYHRVPLLDPALGNVGIAYGNGYVCLNYKDGRRLDAQAQVVLWPPDGYQDVPTAFVGRETPCPTNPKDPSDTPAEQCPRGGFIMTATWYGGTSFGSVSSAPRLMLPPTTDPVPLLAWYADRISGHDPEPGSMPGTIAVVPADNLPAIATVRVEVQALVDGQEEVLSWSFTTGTRAE